MPQWQDRMIRLFGSITPTECAEGIETDNCFIIRAREAMQNNEIGNSVLVCWK
jgi:hypothetical protein